MAAWFSLNFRAEEPNHKELIQPQVGENTVESSFNTCPNVLLRTALKILQSLITVSAIKKKEKEALSLVSFGARFKQHD